MKKRLSFILCALLIICIVGYSSGVVLPASASSPITWRFVSAFPRDAAEHIGFWILYERINNELGDRLRITYLGSTEIVGYFDQFEQLGIGTFEIGHLPVTVAENLMPATNALILTELTPMEMRENGTYEFMRELYARYMNLHFLGVQGGEGYDYGFFTNFEVTGVESFRGRTIRTAPVYVPMLRAMGAGPIAIPGGELYSALERGVVDGFGWSTVGAVDHAWYEVVRYRIEPSFYKCNMGIFVNLDAWNALPEDLQDEVNRIAEEVEKEAFRVMGEVVQQEFATLAERGVRTITLEGEAREEWLNLAYDSGWANLLELDPVNGPILREMVTRPR